MGNIEIFSFILRFTKPYKGHLIALAFVSVIWSIDLSLRPYIIKSIINRVGYITASEATLDSIWAPISWYIALLITVFAFSTFYEYIWVKFFSSFKAHIGSTLIDYLLEKPYKFYHDQFSGGLANNINSAMGSIPRLIKALNEDFFRHFLSITISAYALWQVSPKFTAALLLWIVIYLAACIRLAPIVKTFTVAASQEASKGMGHIVDILANILNVKLFGNHHKETEFVQKNFWQWVVLVRKRDWILVSLYIVQTFSFIVFQAVCLYWLCQGIVAGTVTAGDFVFIFMISISINTNLMGFTRVIADFSENLGTTLHSLKVITSSSSQPKNIIGKDLKLTAGKIVFENVTFCYKNKQPLFEDLNVIIPAGKKVGLVGFSGGGKSSFTNLILRLFDIQSGHIFIDNQDIMEIDENSLRKQIALIPQDPILFHRTLKENIRYGRMDATDEDVIEAAKKAHVHDFIIKLPSGYDSLVGERGIKLSGGQRQRIAIARGILKDAPIMILDEATSQLDSITETYIQTSLWEAMKDKTTIVIAHRLSTLLHMDYIFVFDNGKIVEEGTHQDLLNKVGLYRRLWDAQVGGFLPKKPSHKTQRS